MVSLRHMPPDQVPELKNTEFDLITRFALVAQAPAELEQSAIHRDARRNGKSVGLWRPRRETAGDNRPGFGAGTQGGVSRSSLPGRRQAHGDCEWPLILERQIDTSLSQQHTSEVRDFDAGLEAARLRIERRILSRFHLAEISLKQAQTH